jgi:hypothetical protein
VTFNEELFYNAEDETTAIPIVKAVKVVDVLHKASEITDAGEAIELPITEGEDLLLSASTKQQLRGEPSDITQLLEGQSSKRAPKVEPARSTSLASKSMEIRAGRREIGLLTPNPTPEPEQLGADGEAPQ